MNFIIPSDSTTFLQGLHFKSPETDDIARVQNWLRKPYIQEYFDDPETGLSIQSLREFVQGKKPLFTPWLAYYHNKPFAYLMTSEVGNSDDIYGRWREANGITLTLDILIGEESFLGQGLAPILIQAFIAKLPVEVKALLIDPEESNPKAIHVYQKAGFKIVEEFYPAAGAFGEGRKHYMMKLSRNIPQ